MPLSIEALRSNAEFVRGYFRAHPAASIHEAARAAVDAKQGLHLEEISRIRRELLPELRPMGAALARQVAPLAVKPHPPPQQRPRSPVQILKEAVPLQPPPVETAPEAPQAETPPKGEEMAPPKKAAPPELAMPLTDAEIEHGKRKYGPGADIRKRYLNAYLEKHPGASLGKCQAHMADIFGIAIGAGYFYETKGIAEEVRKAPPVAPPPPVVESARSLPPSPAPPVMAVPEAPPALQWGPPTVQQPLPASLEAELKTLAAAFRLLCEAHQLEEASLAWDAQRKVKANFSRTQRATLEV